MNNIEKAISIILLGIISLSNLAIPVSYAAELKLSSSSAQPASASASPTPAPRQKFFQPASGSVLGASTSLLEIGTQSPNEIQGTAGSANKRIPIRMQSLAKHVYQTTEDVNFAVTNPSDEAFTTTVQDAKNQTVPVSISEANNGTTTSVQLIASNEIKPGVYKVSVTDQEGNTTQQDFSWGVLAINFDKSMYHPGETGDISIGVLNDKGDMVCDAEVNLTITNQAMGINDTLSTAEASESAQKITINPQCQKHDFSLQPDYEAHYHFGKAGVYAIQLSATTLNGTKTITDSIQVTDQIPFDIQRVSATRIYPPNTYPMTMTITAHQDFSGVVTETVPQDFTITPATESATPVASYSDMQTIYLNTNDPGAQLQNMIATSSAGLVMPFQGNYPITQGFGAQLTDPDLQAFYTHYGLAGHDGVDFGLPMGTNLFAVDDGTITWAGPGDYGTTVIIQHTWGESYYGHLSTTAVKVGDHVTKGQLIGYSGQSGEATGPHLHFGMKPLHPDMTNGYYGKVDPMTYLPFGHEPSQRVSSLLNNTAANASSPVLGASDEAALTPTVSETASSAAAIASPTPTSLPSPTVIPSVTPAVTQSISPAEQIHTSSAPTVPAANEHFSVLDSQIRLNEQLANTATTEKVKIISWQVDLKKGESTTVGYDYQAPQVSPQFYLLGPVKLYQNKSDKIIFQEQRQWQIASDDVGVNWYTNTSGNPYNGYSWQYRKKLDISLNNVYATPSAQTVTFMDSGGDATNTNGGTNILASNGAGFYDATTGTVTADCSSPGTTSETGPCSYKFNATASGIEAAVQKNSVLADGGRRISMYVNYATLPNSGGSGKDALISVLNSSNTFIANLVNVNSSGKLCINTSSGANCGSDSLSTGTWYRVSVSYTCTSTSVNQAKIYLNGNLEATETNQTWSTNCGTSNIVIGSGDTNAAADNVVIHADDIYVDSGSDLSDPGDVHVTAKRPNANGAANGFATQIGSGGSGYGTGHAPQVNERPLSTTNGWQTASNATTEEYTIEGASTGDVNIPSNAGLIAGQSWIYTISTATCTTGNAKIINNGVSTNITLPTAANTMLTKYASLTTYPSGNTAVGMSTCTTGAPTIKLFEAGMQVAYIPDLINFPVLINFSSDNDLKGSHTQSNGADILFTDATGRNLLPFEIESYSNSTGSLQAWVNISSLSTANDTIIYMYYGNPATSSQANAHGTWNSNYGALWHYSNSGGVLSLSDSTSNGINATQGGVSNVLSTTGQVDGAADFATNFNNSYLNIPTNAMFKPQSNSISITAWVNLQTGTLTTEQPILSFDDNSTNNGFAFYLGETVNDCSVAGSICFYDSVNDLGVAAAGLSTGTWQQVGIVKSGTTATFYLNGAIVGTDTAVATISDETINNPTIGVDLGTFQNYNGLIDELEYSTTALSPGWITTQYSNENSPSTFVSIQGSVETDIYAPTNDKLMRNGEWFDSTGKIQPFNF